MNEQLKIHDKYIANGKASRKAQVWRNKLCDEWMRKKLEEFPLITPDGTIVPFESYTHEPSDELKKLKEQLSAAVEYLVNIYAAEQSYKKMVAAFDD